MKKLVAFLEGVKGWWSNRAGNALWGKMLNLDRSVNFLNQARSLVVSLTLLAIIAALSAIIVRQLMANSVIVEPIGVPGSLVQNGYTPEVIGYRIVDEMLRIQSKATTLKERNALVPDWSRIDVEMPGSGLSVKAIGRIIRESLGISEKTISGEVVHEDKGYRLRLRFDGGRRIADTSPEAGVDNLIRLGAQDAIKTIDPFMLASYFHATGEKEAMKALIQYCLENDPEKDDVWAYNLRGVSLAADDNYDGAIESYRMAISVNPDFALAYHNWGNALRKQGKYDEAVERYESAIEKDPELTLVISSLGLVLVDWGLELSKNGKFPEAIEKFTEAVKFIPKQVDLYRYWGIALSRENRYPEAIEKFRSTIQLTPKDASTYMMWGDALVALGKKEEAIGKYEKALEIDARNFQFLESIITELRASAGSNVN